MSAWTWFVLSEVIVTPRRTSNSAAEILQRPAVKTTVRATPDVNLIQGNILIGLASASPNPKGDPGDDFAAKAVLQAIQDFLAAVAYDFAEPDAAVHVDEECAIANAGGLGVRGDVRVEEVVPDADNFDFGALLIHAQVGKNLRDEVAHLARPDGLRDFHGREIRSAPLGKDALLGGAL